MSLSVHEHACYNAKKKRKQIYLTEYPGFPNEKTDGFDYD